ncbi:MAG: ArsC/Spx/MgsR family protein [Acidimicrobiia bacterium]|nr:ArsC/Spx/MgsR family protein [Acidimicrobiia bacterium]
MNRLYHNPRCTTSRRALQALESGGITFETVLYLKTPPDRRRLRELIERLEDPPADLVRKDKRFRDLGLEAGDYQDADDVIQLLIEHPELMQRPSSTPGAPSSAGPSIGWRRSPNRKASMRPCEEHCRTPVRSNRQRRE